MFAQLLAEYAISTIIRAAAYALAVDWVRQEIGKLTLEDMVSAFVTDPERKKKILDMLRDPNALGPTQDFIEFLKEWNIRVASMGLRASVVSDALGTAVSRLASAISWSYGFGWLSWVGMSPILNHIVAEPADRALLAAFPSKGLTKSEIERAFKTGMFDERKLREELRMMGYTDEAITTIISIINKEKVEKERDLSKSDILRAYRDGIITDADAIMYLNRLGYSTEEAQILLQLYKPSREAEKRGRTRDLTTSQILQAYRYGVIPDRAAAKRMLIQIGYSEEEAELLLKIEDTKKQIQKHERGRDLSKTDILRALKYRLISPEEAKKMLVEIGYDEDEADILIANAIMEVLEHGGEATTA